MCKLAISSPDEIGGARRIVAARYSAALLRGMVQVPEVPDGRDVGVGAVHA